MVLFINYSQIVLACSLLNYLCFTNKTNIWSNNLKLKINIIKGN